MKNIVLLLLILALVVVESAHLIKRDEMDIIPNEYIVVLKDNISKVQRDAHIAGLLQLILASNSNSKIGFVYDIINGFSVTLTELLLNGELLNPDVKYIEANQRFFANFDTQSNPEWGLDRIDQRSSTRDNTYNYNSTAGENTDIYIIDTGIRTTHNEFGGRATAVFNAIAGEVNQDLNGHGTHVAGITAGATYGVAKKAALKAVKVLSATGTGSTDGVIAGIDYVAQNKSPTRRSIANLSLGGPFSQALDDAVVRSINNGIIMVVAAGNDGLFACLFSPARVSAAITVGATEINNARASYSNFGSCVTLFAPGSAILSSWFTSDSATNSISGTSMATPFVVGVLAVQVSQYPMTHAQAKQWLISTSTPNAVSGAGLFSPNRLLYSPAV